MLRGEIAVTAYELAAVGLPLPVLRPESGVVIELAAVPAGDCYVCFRAARVRKRAKRSPFGSAIRPDVERRAWVTIAAMADIAHRLLGMDCSSSVTRCAISPAIP